MCTATKDMSCINEKKKGGGGGGGSIQMPEFNQSYMAQSEEPDRKRVRFSKVDGDFLAKIRIESVPAATKRSSSCHRVWYLAGHQH